ncbi:MAG: hypothetical protein O2779_01150 [Nanoarchaeota archaeon]|nr:hypothetical protein [Nanoarchaeota archaeon]
MQRDLEQEIKELDQLPEPIKIPNWFKKTSLLLISLTLLYLIVIYFIPSSYIIEFLAARSTSTNLQNNQLIDEGVITFENNTLQLLQTAYKTANGNEIKACLQGSRSNNNILINKIHFPEILHQDFKSVIAKPCPPNTLIDIHSHPSGRCFFSPHDIAVYDNQNIIAIMCGVNTFHLYGW